MILESTRRVEPSKGDEAQIVARRRAWSAQALGALTTATVAAWALITAAVLLSLVDSTVFPTFPTIGAATRKIFPEGWGFFTRNPRQPIVELMTPRADGMWKSMKGQANATPRYFFGARRAGRDMLFEAGVLQSNVTPNGWTKCHEPEAWNNCLNRAQRRTLKVDNTAKTRLICGRVGMVQHEPIPWSWAHQVDAEDMPSSAIVMDVRC